MFITTKDEDVIPYVLTQILDACVNGVTLSDPDLPDSPLVYVNRVFEEMSGYTQDEMIGRNCRFLQGEDRDQAALETLRKAISQHQACTVTLRNYRDIAALGEAGVPIVGNSSATTDTLVLTAVTTAAAGDYDWVVTNIAGTVTSDAATLAVLISTPRSPVGSG